MPRPSAARIPHLALSHVGPYLEPPSLRRLHVRVRHAPTALKFSIANPSESMARWQLAQEGLARWISMRSRMVRGFTPTCG